MKSYDTPTERLLYDSAAFRIYTDRVVQADQVARVHSPQRMHSTYRSPANATFPRIIAFKFSINEKDNELPVDVNHLVAIRDEKVSPIFTFGRIEEGLTIDPGGFLPANYDYTFRVDMRPVLEQFERQGYYETHHGDRIAKSDFKGFYIAGSAEPLTWDFVRLASSGLRLEDPDGDGIYEITLRLNPYDAETGTDRDWQLETDLSRQPHYTSSQPLVDALFNLSLEEMTRNIEADGTFRTGAEWGGVWTRDVSYSALLSLAFLEPEIVKNSLRRKVQRDRIVQDTGSGGAWPVSSDRTTWALAAWEVYKVTGDREWLQEAFTVIRNTVEDDYRTLGSEETGLFRGESSFLDWREQTYPKWMNNVDIYESECLSTNAVHYQTHVILSAMADLLGEPATAFRKRAQQLKDSINANLWLEEEGYYALYLYGRRFLLRSPRFEALGEALCILFGIADEEQAASIVARAPLTTYGISCIYPQIPGIPPYHNNGIWPFVQAFWNLAAARVGNAAVLSHGLAAIYRAAGLFLSNYENMVAETGDFLGTEINSHRMLWSIAGNLAMVHRLFLGLSFEQEGIRFQPVIPPAYGGERRLRNFRYRNATLDIQVRGYGNRIHAIRLDGAPLPEAFLPASIQGHHTVEIEMDNNDFGGKINLVPNRFSLRTPQTRWREGNLSWPTVEGARAYAVYRNGQRVGTTQNTQWTAPAGELAEWKVCALADDGCSSFVSEPLLVVPDTACQLVELEAFAPASPLPYTNYSHEGFIELSTEVNREVHLDVSVEKAGTYFVDFRYSNGSGPWNTDNKCAIRSLYLNEQYIGALVFPQRGQDEWSDWDYCNAYLLSLRAGRNTVRLALEPWNINMNVEVNRAMLDHMRVLGPLTPADIPKIKR